MSVGFSFAYNDPTNQLAQFPLLATDLQAAGQTLGRDLNGSQTLAVQVNVSNDTSHNYIASAGPAANAYVNSNLVESIAEYRENSNTALAPGAFDIIMTVYPGVIASQGFFDPTGVNRDAAVPSGKFDFISVAMHELTHGLGFLSNETRDTNGNPTGGTPDVYDADTTATGGYLYFVGPHAVAAYHGQAVPLYNDHTANSGSNFSHPGNPSPGPGSDLINDLMYFQAQNGVRRNPSDVDLAVLADMGWSVNFTKPADDFSGAGHSDVSIYSPSTSTFGIDPTAGPGQANGGQGTGPYNVQFGGANWTPVPADYTGQGHADVAILNPSTSIWYIAPNAGPNQPNSGQGSGVYSVAFGGANWVPVPADYTGAGHADIAIFNPATAIWYVAPNAGPGQPNANQGTGGYAVAFGGANWTPVPGDYTGSGHADIAVFNPATATWYIDPEAGPGQPNGGQGNNAYSVQWGQPGDIPVPGDYDGTGRTEIAVFRPSTATWYILPNAGAAGPGPGAYAVSFGGANWTPVPGDYNGTGHTDLGVFSQGTATWYIAPNEGPIQANGGQGYGGWSVQYGPAYVTPIEGGIAGGAPGGGFGAQAIRFGGGTPAGPTVSAPSSGTFAPSASDAPTAYRPAVATAFIAPSRPATAVLVAAQVGSPLATLMTSASRRRVG